MTEQATLERVRVVGSFEIEEADEALLGEIRRAVRECLAQYGTVDVDVQAGSPYGRTPRPSMGRIRRR